MYIPVSFIYDDMEIYRLLVVAFRSITGDVWYYVCGVSENCPGPVFIGSAGAFSNVEDAFNIITMLADKYPRVPDDAPIPTFVC